MADEIKWQGKSIDDIDAQKPLQVMADLLYRSGVYDRSLEDEADSIWYHFWAEKMIGLLNGPEMNKVHPDLIKLQAPMMSNPPRPGRWELFPPIDADEYVSLRSRDKLYLTDPGGIFWLDLQNQDLSPDYASVPSQGVLEMVPSASYNISDTTTTLDNYNPKYRQVCSPLILNDGFFLVQFEVSDTAECQAPQDKSVWRHLEKPASFGIQDKYESILLGFFKSLPTTMSPYGLKIAYNSDFAPPKMFAVYTESLPPTCMDLGEAGKWAAVPYYNFHSQGITFKWRYQVFKDIEALLTALNAEPKEETKYLSKFLYNRVDKFYLFLPEPK